jgi:hypothetical protein
MLFALLQAVPVQNFPPVDLPGVDPQLSATIAAACPAPTTDRGQLLRLADRYADSLRKHDSDPNLWVATACLRADLFSTGAIAHEGIEMGLGASWEQGAVNALLRTLALRPGDQHAADLLAKLGLDDVDVNAPAKIRDALERAQTAGAATPATYRACSEFAWRAHDTTATRNCAAASLAAGLDSTWQLIRLARLRFVAFDTAAGNTLFQQAAEAAHDSAAKLEVTWHLQWFLTPDEQREWQHAIDSTPGRWIRDRLASRDVRDGRPAGARLAEHFARLEYVEEHFRLAVPRKIAAGLRTGPATKEAPGLCGSPTSCAEPGGVWADTWREYHRWQTDFDDRGVIWMRFGSPERRIPWVCNCATVREAWVYNIDDRHMLLSFENEAFDGSVEATRLVSGVLGSYFCDVDSRRCGLSTLAQADAIAHGHSKFGARPSAPLVNPEEIEHIRVQDREAIAAATTTDDNGPRGQRFVETVARLHRLWDPAGGDPLALITYGIRNADLKTTASAEKVDADIAITVRQWDPAADTRRDTTLHRHSEFNASKMPRDWTGFVLLPSTSGVSAWSVAVTQPDHRLGRAFEDPGTPLGTGPIALSDLVIGATGEPLRWGSGADAIPLAPFDAVNRTDTLQLYYEVRSTKAANVHTVLALYRTDIPKQANTPALQVASATTLRAGIDEMAPSVVVSQLAKGEYRIEVRIEDANGQVLARRTASLTLL